MKCTLLFASSIAVLSLILAPPVWARGFGGGGGGRGGGGGGRSGGYGGGGYHGGQGGYHGGPGGYHGAQGGYHGNEGGYHGGSAGGYGGYHGGAAGRGNYEDGFHGGEGGYRGGDGQHPGTNVAGSQNLAGHGLDNQLFGAQGAGKNLSNVNPSNLQGAGKNLNGSNLSNLQGAGKNLSNVDPNNFNGNHLQQWQQHQPYNNWYQGHGNWGNGQLAGAAGNWAGSGLGAAAAGWGLGAAGLAATAVPGWGLGAYYDSGYGSYYNPYYDDSGDDSSSGYDYSQPVQFVQYNAPQSQQGDGGGSNNNGPTASDDALQHGEAARTAFRNQDYSKALSEANLALAKMPGDPGLHEFRALVLFALGQYKPAAAAIHSILAVGPGWNWTTMIGLYGDDTTIYTRQLRALESAVTSNPDSSSDHFLLAYQYLCCNQNDSAAAQLQKVIELTPKDQLAPQLLATISKPADGSTPSAPAPAAAASTTAKPLAASALVGDWTSKRDDGSTIELNITSDSKFTWTYTAKGKTQKFGGTAADTNGLLALQRDDGNALMAHVTSSDGGGFRFRLVGGPANDPGLLFTH